MSSVARVHVSVIVLHATASIDVYYCFEPLYFSPQLLLLNLILCHLLYMYTYMCISVGCTKEVIQ